MKAMPYILHALSPLHAGTGQAADIIDLPIARLRATGIPFIPGSSIKGVLRESRRQDLDDKTWRAVFGPDTSAAAEHAGALIVSDARLLALPVRSFKGTFAWVTSPLLLMLAGRDLDGGDRLRLAAMDGRQALVPSGSAVIVSGKNRLYLEDLDVPAKEDGANLLQWTETIGRVFGDDIEIFKKRFVVVDDETMTFLWETATQVDARVRIDAETRTVAKRALWLEESLPPETLLVGTLLADRSRRADTKLDPAAVLSNAIPAAEVIQFGGKATVGRGRCRLVPLGDKEATK
ncbi:MAG: type III-B CRISPR module RAMP protein Cmr4 [Rhodospirillales bacterium]|nr:type III-B CRISPR module RAMP protein Cmr4 [Rhodospirillales bacterium]